MIAATGTDLATSLLVFAGGGGGVALITGLFGHRRTRAEANDINATATLKMSDSWERLVAQLQERLDDQDILTAAGTWRLDVSHFTAANAAIAVASIDGTTVATKDHYSAATVYDREWSATGLTLAAGRHTLRITASGKNASSSGYLLYFTGVAMRRTGA